MRMSQNRTKIAALAAAPVLAVAVALTGGVFTHHAVAAASLEQVAVGGITLVGGGHVAFAAHVLIKNLPGSPTFHYSGYVVQEDAMGNSMSGPVTCAFVSDNKARVIWTVNHSDTGGVGQTRKFDVTDNGEPVLGMPQDQFMDLGTTCATCDCFNPPSGGGVMPLHGNIVVKGG